MLKTRIAAGATAIVLGISGVAFANADGSADVQANLSASTAAADLDASAQSQTSASVATPATMDDSSSTSVTSGSSTTSVTTAGSSTTSVTVDDNSRTSTTIHDSTSTTIDDRSGDDDSSFGQETRTTVTLGLATHTIGEAGTVTVNGMTLVAVQANAGWTYEIDEVSTDRIRVEFEKGEIDAEFELRVDGELRIKIHD
jgi:hypothetical protein